MKKILSILMIVGAIVFTACATDNKKETTGDEKGASTLVTHFSAQGHTKALAEKVAAVPPSNR